VPAQGRCAAGGGVECRLVAVAAQARRQQGQHLALFHGLADARERAAGTQDPGRRRHDARFAIGGGPDRAGGNDRGAGHAAFGFGGGKLHLPLLFLGEGNARVVMVASMSWRATPASQTP
jgi:hypothetical protein